MHYPATHTNECSLGVNITDICTILLVDTPVILAEGLTAWIMSLTIIYGIQELILFSKYHNLQIHSFTDKVVIICQQHYPDMDASFTNGYPIIQTMVSAQVILNTSCVCITEFNWCTSAILMWVKWIHHILLAVTYKVIFRYQLCVHYGI